jgi:tetrathionate reductase subunit C
MNGPILELTGFTQEPAWLPWAVQYFFLIGISLGAFVLTLPAYVGGRGNPETARAALIAALIVGIAAPVALVADLHQQARFWHFYLSPNGSSWMAWGAFFLPAYVAGLLLYGWLALRPAFAARAGRDLAGRIAALLAGDGAARPRLLAAVGLFTAAAAVLVALYTGAEMAVVKARPLWNTPLLPVGLLATALAGGAGLALLFTGDRAARASLARGVTVGSAAALTVALAGAVAGLSGEPSGRAMLDLATAEPMAVGLLIIGLLGLPLLLAAAGRALTVAGLLALAGAWSWRWELFMDGQRLPKSAAGVYDYTLPLGPEGLAGILGSAGLVVLIALALFAVLPSRQGRA